MIFRNIEISKYTERGNNFRQEIMKIAIITWCTYTNFGTYLQAYALQHYLEEKGYKVKLLDDCLIISIHKSVIRRFLGSIKKNIRIILKPSLNRLQKQDVKSINLFQKFRDRFLDIDKDIFPLQSLDNKYDIYICGSDQIWNPFGFENDKNKEYYFASFSKNKKIAYAPSIGVKKIPIELKQHYSKLLSSFSYLSSRETPGVEELSQITHSHIENVVDPTLLLARCEWQKLLGQYKKNKNEEKYVLLYLLTYNHKYVSIASSYAKKLGVKLKIIHSIGVDINGMKTECAGPLDFLYLIENALFILTDSFHGSIFSIIFEKQFLTFKRFKDNDKNGQNTRVIDLMNKVNLHDRLFNEDRLDHIFKLKEINYSAVKELLYPYIQSSKDYLERALNS